MRNKRLLLYAIFITGIVLLAMCLTASAASVPRISTDELKTKLGSADLVVLDVRANWDWVKSEEQIPRFGSCPSWRGEPMGCELSLRRRQSFSTAPE